MAQRSTQVPRIVCTGYELTEPLRRYLEVGHGMDPSGDLFISLGDDDHDEEDYDDIFGKPNGSSECRRISRSVRMYADEHQRRSRCRLCS